MDAERLSAQRGRIRLEVDVLAGVAVQTETEFQRIEFK